MMILEELSVVPEVFAVTVKRDPIKTSVEGILGKSSRAQLLAEVANINSKPVSHHAVGALERPILVDVGWVG